MALANFDDYRIRAEPAPKPRRRAVPAERVSDVWPDWSTELNAAELADVAARNKPSLVLGQAAIGILYSVGLVFLLMAAVSLLR